MSDRTLTRTRIHAGRWEGLVMGAGAVPEIAVLHLGRPLDAVTVEQVEDGWAVSVPIPGELLADGVQTFVVSDTTHSETLGHFTIVTGVPLENDLRAEIDLLRAELDMLKKAFRRFSLEAGA